mgnify:CR=1 FL=1
MYAWSYYKQTQKLGDNIPILFALQECMLQACH